MSSLESMMEQPLTKEEEIFQGGCEVYNYFYDCGKDEGYNEGLKLGLEEFLLEAKKKYFEMGYESGYEDCSEGNGFNLIFEE